jgi:hypothetical protein
MNVSIIIKLRMSKSNIAYVSLVILSVFYADRILPSLVFEVSNTISNDNRKLKGLVETFTLFALQ